MHDSFVIPHLEVHIDIAEKTVDTCFEIGNIQVIASHSQHNFNNCRENGAFCEYRQIILPQERTGRAGEGDRVCTGASVQILRRTGFAESESKGKEVLL